MSSELDPADVRAKLGLSLTPQFFAVVMNYAEALPIDAAHVVQSGANCHVYWVSGTALVVLDLKLVGASDSTIAEAHGEDKQLKSAGVRIRATATPDQMVTDWHDWSVTLTVELRFEADVEPLILPHPQTRLDNDIGRAHIRTFLNALLRATA